MLGERFEPTAEQRRTVRAMCGFGVPQTDIAVFLDIDPKTLRKHFREELDRGGIEATAKVAQSLFRMATEGNNVAAAIFWMKARAGWRDRASVEHSVAGTPFAVISGVPRAEDDLTDAQLMKIARRRLDEDEEEPVADRPAATTQRGRGVLRVPRAMTEDEWMAKYGWKHVGGVGHDPD